MSTVAMELSPGLILRSFSAPSSTASMNTASPTGAFFSEGVTKRHQTKTRSMHISYIYSSLIYNSQIRIFGVFFLAAIGTLGLQEKTYEKLLNLVPPTDLNRLRTRKDECRSRTDYAPKKSSSETAAPTAGRISATIAQILLSYCDTLFSHSCLWPQASNLYGTAHRIKDMVVLK